jgi:long-subunit acyl-CoA synthetase (AMP-forming)
MTKRKISKLLVCGGGFKFYYIYGSIRYLYEINILQKEDEEIDALLIERNYPKFGSGNNDDNEDIDTFSYEYLLNMKIKSLTKKKIEELKKLHENKLAVYNELLLKSEKDLWKDDLNKFLDIYKKKIKEYDEKMNDQIKSLNAQNGSGKKTNKKK